MANIRGTLRRWHIWLGWIVGVPLLLWTLSGFFMVLKPIEEVRGEHLLREEAPLLLSGPPVAPLGLDGASLNALRLEQRTRGPVWVVELGETTRIADPADGRWLDPYSAQQASAELLSRYAGDASVVEVRATDAEDPPLDWRRQTPAWAVTMDDGTRFYVERETGRIAATRTGWWRAFDVMWGLHIMDLETREDINNNWVRVFAAAALLAVVMALILLPLASRRRRRR